MMSAHSHLIMITLFLFYVLDSGFSLAPVLVAAQVVVQGVATMKGDGRATVSRQLTCNQVCGWSNIIFEEAAVV